MLPPDDRLKEELCAHCWFETGRFDERYREIAIDSKDDVKKGVGRSLDRSDAFALKNYSIVFLAVILKRTLEVNSIRAKQTTHLILDKHNTAVAIPPGKCFAIAEVLRNETELTKVRCRGMRHVFSIDQSYCDWGDF